MGRMQFKGPPQRAKEFKQAANRLRWEIDWALGRGDLMQNDHPRPWEVQQALFDLSEAVSIIGEIAKAIDEEFPEGSEGRAWFSQHLAFYRDYHRIPR